MACNPILLYYFGISSANICTQVFQDNTLYYIDGDPTTLGSYLHTSTPCTGANLATSGYYAYIDNGIIHYFSIDRNGALNKLDQCNNCAVGSVKNLTLVTYTDCCGNYTELTPTVNDQLFVYDPNYPVTGLYSFYSVTPRTICPSNSPTPTHTPTPTLTPTPTPTPKSIYVSGCCDGKIYRLLSGIKQPIGNVIRVAPFNFCYTVITQPIILPTNTLNDNLGVSIVEEDCYDISCQPCPSSTPTPTPTQTPGNTPTPTPAPNLPPIPAAGSVGSECKIITIENFEISCSGTNPTTYASLDGSLTAIVSGGTAPYYYIWSGPNSSYYTSKTITNIPSGDYILTVYDYFRDFTATTTCTITGPKDCEFGASYFEFLPPSPSPTPTLTPTPATSIPLCAVLFVNNIDGKVYTYNVATNASVLLTIPSLTFFADDIAHTANKLWIPSGSTQFLEWDITLTPFTASFNRAIPYPVGYLPSFGLGAIDDTTILAVNTSTTPHSVVEIDVSGPSAVMNTQFSLLSNRRVTGDFFKTTNNKFIVSVRTITPPVQNYVNQYDYITHLLDVEILLSSVLTNAFGIFEDSGNIYLGRGTSQNGDIYRIDTNYPYLTTFVNNSGIYVAGASQVPSCLTADFSPAPTPTPTVTVTSSSGIIPPSPSVTKTPTVTPTITKTPTATPTMTPTVTRSGIPAPVYSQSYEANVFRCRPTPQCGMGYTITTITVQNPYTLSLGKFYRSSDPYDTNVYEPYTTVSTPAAVIVSYGSETTSCNLACAALPTYRYYLADKYSCSNCTLVESGVEVAVANWTLNVGKWYSNTQGVFSYYITSGPITSSPAGQIILFDYTISNNCADACVAEPPP